MVGNDATTMMRTFTVSESEIDSEDFRQWGYDAFLLGSKHAYAGIQEHEQLPDDYVETNAKITERQIVLGGHRLAHVISDIFGSSKAI